PSPISPTPPPTILAATAPPPTALHTLSLHDALPICRRPAQGDRPGHRRAVRDAAQGGHRELRRAAAADDPVLRHHAGRGPQRPLDRKSTRLNSSHVSISYAVFCLKNKQHAAEDVGR